MGGPCDLYGIWFLLIFGASGGGRGYRHLRGEIEEDIKFGICHQLLARLWNCLKLDQPRLVVSDCQKFFGFLPVTYQIDIRTAKFLEKIMISDNGICMFERYAKIGINEIFSTYGNVYRLEVCHWWTVPLLVTVSKLWLTLATV